jgi:hypothetical protein
MGPKVLAVIDTALDLFGADPDPDCWVAWGDDPGVRYQVMIPSPAGLQLINVRVHVPGEGPRAAAKLVRWNRLQMGEYGIEIQGGHRMVNVQIEHTILRGRDEEADGLARFVRLIYEAMDGPAWEVGAAPSAPTASAVRRRRGKAILQLPAPKESEG